jgi:hypothetical protein
VLTGTVVVVVVGSSVVVVVVMVVFGATVVVGTVVVGGGGVGGTVVLTVEAAVLLAVCADRTSGITAMYTKGTAHTKKAKIPATSKPHTRSRLSARSCCCCLILSFCTRSHTTKKLNCVFYVCF